MKYEKDGFAILALPCNQFGGQEPDDVETILKKTAKKYGRTFPLMSKIDVLAAHPLFKELLDPQESLISWNFHKFLVDRHGRVTGSYKPKISPKTMEKDIVSLLKRSAQ